MLITHYTYFDGSGGDVRGVTRFFNGKAMPLFVFLGGLGFTMLTRRAAHPVAQALARGSVLVVIGLLLVEHAPLIAVILQFYGLFFALGLLVRRLPGVWLLVLAGVTTLVGGWSWLHLAPDRVRYGGWQGWETVTDPRPLFIDLLVSGSYPGSAHVRVLPGRDVGRPAGARPPAGAGAARRNRSGPGAGRVRRWGDRHPGHDRPSGAHRDGRARRRSGGGPDRGPGRAPRRVPPGRGAGRGPRAGTGRRHGAAGARWPTPSVTARCRPGSSGRRGGRWPSSGWACWRTRDGRGCCTPSPAPASWRSRSTCCRPSACAGGTRRSGRSGTRTPANSSPAS